MPALSGVGACTNSGSSGSAAGGATAGAGAPSGGGAAVAGSTGSESGHFTLRYRDEFETLDATRWQVMTHSWDTNLALFSDQSVEVQNGQLALSLLPAPVGTSDAGGTPKSFLGAEVRSLDTLTYGRVRARVKLASGSAVVSSLVTIYTPYPADNWNELDVEHLGSKAQNVQFNAMVYTGPPVQKPATTSVTPTQDPFAQTLAFDASADFHVYTIDWTPGAATFSVDDVVQHTWTKQIALMTLPQNVLLTIWASSSVSWAGPVTPATSQAVAVYDWVELYDYVMN